jgi:DNA-binding transcriptional MerR regulator
MKELGIKKLYYSISEVSKITGLEQYVLRYWENEFEELKPAKNRAGNRIYTNKDIQVILKIKKLLKDEKYTIEGAKKLIKDPEELKPKINQITENTEIETKENNESEDQVSFKKDLEQIKSFLVYLQSKL